MCGEDRESPGKPGYYEDGADLEPTTCPQLLPLSGRRGCIQLVLFQGSSTGKTVQQKIFWPEYFST